MVEHESSDGGVLVVAPNASIGARVADGWRAAGCRVWVVEDGDLGLRDFRDIYDEDVVVCLCGESESATLELCRAQKGVVNRPTICWAPRTTPSYLNAALANGADAFLDERSGEDEMLGALSVARAHPVSGAASGAAHIGENHRAFPLRTLFDRHSAVMLLIEPESGDIVDANEAAVNFYGYEKEQLFELKIQDLNQLDAFTVAERRRQAFERQCNVFRFKHRVRSGKIKTVEVHSTPINIHGKLLLFSIIHDITERDKLEAQLQHAMKMESVGRLAGGVAHDFNNMLTGIVGLISMAKLDLSREDPLQETLEEIYSAVDRASSLTRQLLAFSRKQIIRSSTVNLNALIEKIESMLARTIGEDVIFETDLEENLKSVIVDPGQIEQVIVNLSINARDAMPHGGTLKISTKNIELRPESFDELSQPGPGEYVLLSVSDTGQGISDEMKDKIFEPFFTTKKKGQGTGLGLSTVYGVVRQHHGFVDVVSSVGQGACFSIYLPCSENSEIGFEKSHYFDNLPRSNGSETVLVVEDDDMVRGIAVKVLKRLGYCVIEAANGESAIAKVTGDVKALDLLLTDIVMPKMNGRELADEILSIVPKTRVLYTSGYARDAIAQRGIMEGELCFLSKPYTPVELARMVRRVLDDG